MKHNLIERLLLECPQPSRGVPAESGVQFRVTKPARDDIVCLIFKVDLTKNPLVARGPRPDDLVFHGSPAGLLLTIVEMKGKDQENLEHGIEQIQAFDTLLRSTLREHLPTKLRFHIQGILLAPYGAQLPLVKLGKIARGGLVICPLQYHHQAELYPYVSRPLSLTEPPYRHAPTRSPGDNFSHIERILIHHAEPTRRRDSFLAQRWQPGRPGIYINYRSPLKEHRAHYLALAGDNARLDVGVRGPDDALHDFISTQLAPFTAPARRLLQVHRIDG